MAQLETIFSILGNFRSVDTLKKLLWTELNYDRANQPLPIDSWTERQREGIAAEPTVIATHDSQFGSFNIIYCPIDKWDKARSIEREVINVLLREHPYALFVFSDSQQRNWHFVNVKYAKDASARRLFRRITVGPYERIRTATERLAMLDLATLSPDLSSLSPLAIQQRHDEAFNVEAVTKEFFREYDRIFKNAERLISGIDGDAHRLFTQKLFNRLMFIVFLERKGWLKLEKQSDHDYLLALWETYQKQKQRRETASENFYRDRLKMLFFLGLNTSSDVNIIGAAGHKRTFLHEIIGDVPYLNGGLFEEGEDDKDNTIRVPDDAIQPAIDELFYHFNFTVTESTPFDKEVAVDPEMLGKIFEELVTGRHETGSYYTPRSIVSFMGREALNGYLRTTCKESSEAVAAFVDNLDASTLRDPEAVLEALKALRICDPACGSGAYLLGMMQELLELRQALFTAKSLDNVTIYRRKLEIIQNNVYGVDIDPFAVNIARLRLWLSLIVDFEAQPGQMPPPLPNLDYKVEVGDSLLGPEPSGGMNFPPMDRAYRAKQIEQYRTLKEKYLDAHGSQKTELRKQIEDKRQEIRDWLRSGKQEALLTGYDWAVEFTEVFAPDGNEQGGFDIVLANPPYVRQELIKDQKPALKQVYGDKYTGTADLYTYFYFRGLQLLRPGGELVFISSNKWLRAAYGEKLRIYLKEHTTVNVVIDFGDLPVFGATAYPCIIAVRNERSSDEHKFRALNVKDLSIIDTLDYEVEHQGWMQSQISLTQGGWVMTRSEVLELQQKLKKICVSLGEYVKGSAYRGLLTGFNEAFVIDEETRYQLISQDQRSSEIIKPYLRGRDVKRWRAQWAGIYLISVQNSGDAGAKNPWGNAETEAKARSIFKRTYPAIHDHLTQYEDQLRIRQDQGRFWWELRACAYYAEFAKPKIAYQKFQVKPVFLMDTSGVFINDAMWMISLEDYYLLGCLNSKMGWFEIARHCTKLQNGYQLIWDYFQQVLIPMPESSVKMRIASLAKELTHVSDVGQQSALETEIDHAVYQAYSLSDVEIALVEAEITRKESARRLGSALSALSELGDLENISKE